MLGDFMEYKIIGNNMQNLRITLEEGEKVYADSGKLISKSLNTVMTPRMAGGIMQAIEREVTGASALLTEFTSKEGPGDVSVGGVFPGKVYIVDLKDGQQFAAEDYAFLAAEDTVKFSIQPVNIGAAFFGGAGLVLQRFIGPGKVFIHVVGDIVEYDLDGTNTVEIDPGHIAGFDEGLSYKIRFVDNIRTAMFGGVGLFLATFSGKGRLIVHSVSRLKLSAEMFAAGAQAYKGKK